MTEVETTRSLEKASELFEMKKFAQLKDFLGNIPPQDIAVLISEMDIKEAAFVFRLLKKDDAADVLIELDGDMQEDLIRAFSDKELSLILEELFVDDMADIIDEMPAGIVKKILKNAAPEQRKSVNEILKFPKDSAGGIMTTEFVDFKADMTVKECFDHIRETGEDKESVYTGYVIDAKRHLLGVVCVKDMLFADYDDKVSDIMNENVVCINTFDDKEEVARLFDKYDFLAIPVIDKERRLVGIVTIDDAMDVMQEENTEDFEKMAAITPNDKGYFETGVFSHAKNRILWLLILMVSATFTGRIITRYEDAFRMFPVLVAMIPMLMDTGGNCGSQASTMIIRGLALYEIHPKDVFKVWFKEIRIALVVGISLALVNVLRVFVFYGGQNEVGALTLALITGITLVCEIILAKTLGCLMPLAAKRLKLDPAIMAAPLITTIVDACCVMLYFTIACAILNISV